MPFYYQIDSATEEGRRTARKLIELRQALSAAIPARSVEESLLLATWNIREFDSSKYGLRTDEAIYYIAEIISRFDLVAVQEVRADLEALRRLLKVLGSQWDYIVTDVTEGTQGNRERLAFVYDSRKVRFSKVAGEIVLPPRRVAGQLQNGMQFARTPFAVAFQAGWFKFMLCTVHIVYGDDDPDTPERIAEIDALAEFLAKRKEADDPWGANLILLGDFNICQHDDQTFKALTAPGRFVVPTPLQAIPGSNVDKKKHYDQIAFRVDGRMKLNENRCGVFDFFEIVYRADDAATYEPEIKALFQEYGAGQKTDDGKPAKVWKYKEWRTYQMSDHLPMWIELKVDFAAEYLQGKTEPPPAPP